MYRKRIYRSSRASAGKAKSARPRTDNLMAAVNELWTGQYSVRDIATKLGVNPKKVLNAIRELRLQESGKKPTGRDGLASRQEQGFFCRLSPKLSQKQKNALLEMSKKSPYPERFLIDAANRLIQQKETRSYTSFMQIEAELIEKHRLNRKVGRKIIAEINETTGIFNEQEMQIRRENASKERAAKKNKLKKNFSLQERQIMNSIKGRKKMTEKFFYSLSLIPIEQAKLLWRYYGEKSSMEEEVRESDYTKKHGAALTVSNAELRQNVHPLIALYAANELYAGKEPKRVLREINSFLPKKFWIRPAIISQIEGIVEIGQIEKPLENLKNAINGIHARERNHPLAK